MSYHHLTTFERGNIEALSRKGYSLRQIATHTGRSVSTVSRELKRCPGVYSAKYAQWQYHKLREFCRPRGKATPKNISLIEQHLILTWSPEQIAQTVAKGQVSCKTIYNWLYAGKLMSGDRRVLRHKGKRSGSEEKRGRFATVASIHDRPAEVDDRSEFGHWELDSVLSGYNQSRACLATFVERKSRLYTAIRMPDRTASAMKQAIEQLKEVIPAAVKSVTCDRGKEFACHKDVEKLGVPVWFADPYSPWQRGSNENANGLLREFFPKGCDLGRLSQAELSYVLFLLNSRPRKCLNWQSTIQVFLHEFQLCST